MKPTTRAFKAQSAVALRNAQLQDALGRAKSRFIDKRAHALEELPEFDALRAQAKKTKDHTLNHLDYYLERFESQVVANGGRVHWTRTPEEARRAVIDICRQADGRRVIKGKSMIGEEIALNEELAAQGMEVVETDLGEYIIQLAEEPPSHIIAP
ncbi:MAG: LUD domain-containing protein, partial [Gammaproteobacteria bacterium]